jgi:hypothetical protein
MHKTEHVAELSGLRFFTSTWWSNQNDLRRTSWRILAKSERKQDLKVLGNFFACSHSYFQIENEISIDLLNFFVVEMVLVKHPLTFNSCVFLANIGILSEQVRGDDLLGEIVILGQINNPVRNNTHLLQLKGLLFCSWEAL